MIAINNSNTYVRFFEHLNSYERGEIYVLLNEDQYSVYCKKIST